MSAATTLTSRQIDAHLERLQKPHGHRDGVHVYDLRGLSADAREKLLAAAKADIAAQKNQLGLTGYPATFVACSGQSNDPVLLEEAREVGRQKRVVVTGGSAQSLMGAAAEGSDLAIGVTCNMIMARELPDARYKIIIIADGPDLHDRLNVMREITEEEVALQGGMGTLEEIIGGISVRQRLELRVPHWNPFIEQLKTMHQYGYISSERLDIIEPFHMHDAPCQPLSRAVEPHRDGAAFRSLSRTVSNMVFREMEKRRGRGILCDGGDMPDDRLFHDFFLMPPANIDGMLQAIEASVAKRLLKHDPQFAGIADKPIAVLNIDGYYDQFMKQWRDMEAGGYLAETVDELFTEIKVDSRHIEPADIREAVATAFPSQRGTLRAPQRAVAALARKTGETIEPGISKIAEEEEAMRALGMKASPRRLNYLYHSAASQNSMNQQRDQTAYEMEVHRDPKWSLEHQAWEAEQRARIQTSQR